MKKHLLFLISLMSFISVAGICANILLKANAAETGPASFNAVTSVPGIQQAITQDPNLGIGPVKKVEIGPLNNKMVNEGKNIFNAKCIICHDLDQKKIGPALRNMTKERTPEYIMNLMVNYAQMLKEDPLLKSTVKKFNNVPMTDPALNQEQARSLLEYLRSVAK